jgi:predicted ArsR family transcriptional regulator
MFFRTLRDLARPQIVAIFDVLKRSDGLAVGDLADALKMSYMGVKQYCIELEKRGYLDTWRRAKETGRPELTYRLTPKAQLLFPQHSNELSMEILDAVRQLHGPTAAEKLLYQYFLNKTEAYTKKLKGKTLAERATSLAKLRENEGHCAQVDYDPRHGLRLTEFHSPLSELIKTYPSVARMEESMLSKLLQAPVQREMSAVSGLMRITFLIAGASLPPPAPPTTTVRTHAAGKRTGKSALPPAETETAPAELLESLPAVTAPVPAVAADPLMAGAEAAPVAEAIAAVVTEPIPGDVHEEADASAVPDFTAEASAPLVASAVDASEPRAADPPLQLEEEPLLFTTPAALSPSPRPAVRGVAPGRPPAKPVEPAAEELLLSL